MVRRRAILNWSLAASLAAPGVGVMVAASRALAAPLAAPTGKVILTLRGKITVHNAADEARFDLAMLDALPQGRFEGETPWTKGTTVLTGPLGAAMLDAVGATGTGLLRVTALNDYSADVPVSDLRQYAVILATRHDGAVMPVRDKGPVWVIYPMDKVPSLRVETTYTRSVWQVTSIEVM